MTTTTLTEKFAKDLVRRLKKPDIGAFAYAPGKLGKNPRSGYSFSLVLPDGRLLNFASGVPKKQDVEPGVFWSVDEKTYMGKEGETIFFDGDSLDALVEDMKKVVCVAGRLS